MNKKITIPTTDPRLKRTVHHDERSKDFMFDTSNITIVNTEHKRFIPVLNQGQVGSCTGNAGIGAIYTSPFVAEQYPVFQPTEDGALALYSSAEEIDGSGHYPPTDVGSSGLSVAKALKNVGMISGYQHTFTLQDALKALTQYPVITGTNWYQGMFTPDADGRVHPTGALVGGHEYEAYKIDVDNGRIYFYNSWGTEWGVNGTFYMTWADYASLLAKNGDVTILLPLASTPAPIVAPATAKIDLWCQGAIHMENADPTLNNPGNIRYVNGTWMAKLAIGSKYGFCVFKDYQTGYNTLKELFINAATGKSTIYHPTDTLYQFYSKYAPSADHNNPNHYAEYVASVIGVLPTVQIKTLI